MMDQTLQHWIQTAQKQGIQTRMVPCQISIESTLLPYDPLSLKQHKQEQFNIDSIDQERVQKILQEYEILGISGNDIITQALHIAGKEKDSSIALMLELLAQAHQKLIKIEQFLMKESKILLPLELEGLISAMGHGVLCCADGCFKSGSIYYARFSLPHLSQRIMGFVLKALDDGILQIIHTHSHDNDALDGYIVAKEMEQLRQKRIKHD